MANKTAEVIVVWKNSPKDEHVNVLSGFTGTRVYEKDAIDPRAYLGEDLPPYFDNLGDALSYMTDHPTKVCQLDKRVAKRAELL